MKSPQMLMALSAATNELACYKAEYGELRGETEHRCAFCGGSTFGPAQLDPAMGPPAHSECFLRNELALREKEVLALRAALGTAEKK